MFQLGKTSLQRLEGVNHILVNVVKRAIQISKVDFMVVEGVRTFERQKELYAQGRTKPGKIVTWTMDSKHIDAIAVDLVPWVDGKADWNNLQNFDQVALAMFRAASEQGVKLRWGADWNNNGVKREKGETDSPHFELVM